MNLEQMLEKIQQLTPKPETPMWHRPLNFFGSKHPEVAPLTPYDWAKLQSEALQLIITELIELKRNNAK